MPTFHISNMIFYPDFWQDEDPIHYEPGGYHPIIIGNILRSPASTASYRIFHKLGSGALSTVWLAESSDPNHPDTKFVAVKVSRANDVSSSEAAHLRSMSSSPYIVPVFDSFSLQGVNGTHQVLVTEVVVPLSDFSKVPHDLGTLKKIIWQLVKAVEDLHAAGLVHGDLHIGNTGVTLPKLQSQRIWDIVLYMDEPVLIPILLDDITKRTDGIPPYLTCRASLMTLHKELTKGDEYEPQARLFDFGSVRRQGADSSDLMCATPSCAPEILHPGKPDETSNIVPLHPASDIWALGTVILEIMAGFSHFIRRNLYSSDGVFNMCDPEDEWWSRTRAHLRERCVDDADCDRLVALLKKILRFDPADRPSAAAIAQDRWFDEVGPGALCQT